VHHACTKVRGLLSPDTKNSFLEAGNVGRKRKRGENGRPWFRKQNEGWYIKVQGKAIRLADKDGEAIRGREREGDAVQRWHEMMAVANAPVNRDENQVRVILDLYLQKHLEGNAAEKTFKEWLRIYKSFRDRWPDVLVRELAPNHLRTWWDEHPTWGSSYRNSTGTAIKAALNWAAGAEIGHLITKNPLDGMRLPPMRSRGRSALIADADHNRLVAAVPQDLRDVLVALWYTGSRPSLIWRATKANLDLENRALVYADWNTDPSSSIHKTFKKTNEPLTVPLPPPVFDLCCKLAERYPEGELFRTAKGRPWDEGKLADRVGYYKKKLGLKNVICYGYRHTVSTDLLLQGVSDVEVAAILGHKSTKMIHQHYGHLAARTRRLNDTLSRYRKAPGGEGTGG
jgi:integrase